jgi:hypothetical protein
MKLKINSTFGFSLKLLLTLLIVFAIHITILNALNLPLFNNKIILSYVVNFLMASGIFTLLYFLNKKQESYIGFIYLGGSFLKFILFFLLFYPFYREDGIITKPELFSFLTPYFLCLIIETYSLVKLMNNNK